MSEGAAFRRINAARLVRRFPTLLARIERGELHLSTLVLMRPHLTEGNVDELCDAVSGKTHREVEAFLARVAPKPDVPSQILELPPLPVPPNDVRARASADTTMPQSQQRIEPLSASRYRVQLTASAELRDKLQRASDLMRHRNPTGDLAIVVERALDALLAKLEKERLGRTARPQRNVRSSKPGRIRRAVRREVFERDGEQCTFVSDSGDRCPSRTLLELDHVDARALGGGDDATNLRVRCRAHNRLHAEEVFGKEHIARAVDFRHRKSRRVANDVEKPGEAIDLALRGLVNLGFRRLEARRALDIVSARCTEGPTPLPVQELLREALGVLA
jgi:5-methylcytosine-specific restriction endonuclease McrA